MRLVLFETSGNQRYIFSSNRLRENVGASELTFRAGTRFVFAAVREALKERGRHWAGPDDEGNASSAIRSFLRDSRRNPPAAVPGWIGVEFIQATSGKALLLVEDESLARRIIERATRKALEEAPGLDLTGAIGGEFDPARDEIGPIDRGVHQRLQQVRGLRPGPDLRFPRLPFAADCASSGLPAAGWDARRREDGPLSRPVLCKRAAHDDGWRRLNDLSGGRLTRDINALERRSSDDSRWIAVLHADGNGLGQIFTRFEDHLPKKDFRTYVETLRDFSLALEECTETAFRKALDVFSPGSDPEEGRPVVPLVLGGDDLTVICPADRGLEFAQTFLEVFEKETATRTVCREVTGWDRITMAAGIAIVKPHFPFHLAYGLAEQLLAAAKRVSKRAARDAKCDPAPSSLDFHVLRDASGTDLEAIRNHLTLAGTTRLYAGPYLVNAPEALGAWAAPRRWERLRNRVHALQKKDAEGRRRLPSSQMHALREGLFTSAEEANRRLGMIRYRYDPWLRDLVEGGTGEHPSLFWEERGEDGDGTVRVTGFLDAMEAASVWKPGTA